MIDLMKGKRERKPQLKLAILFMKEFHICIDDYENGFCHSQ